MGKKYSEMTEEEKEKKREYRKLSYQRNKSRGIAKAKEWRLNNREKIKKWYKLWANNNAEKLREKKKQWADNNTEKLRELSKKKREILLDTYVKSRLRRNGFPKEAITPELIEVQRLIIKTKRLTKNKLKENENEKHSRT